MVYNRLTLFQWLLWRSLAQVLTHAAAKLRREQAALVLLADNALILDLFYGASVAELKLRHLIYLNIATPGFALCINFRLVIFINQRAVISLTMLKVLELLPQNEAVVTNTSATWPSEKVQVLIRFQFFLSLGTDAKSTLLVFVVKLRILKIEYLIEVMQYCDYNEYRLNHDEC